MAEGGLGGTGVYIGTDAYGGSFVYDPWALYQRALTSPNLLILGRLGMAKSSLVKTYLWRQSVFGRMAWIVDPKGEYGPLAAAFGVRPIQLEPGGEVRLNPLTRHAGEADQLALLQAVAAGALRRLLGPEEQAGLRVALHEVKDQEVEPTIPAVVGRLLHPSDGMAAPLATTPDALGRECRETALALQRLCEGELRGMFDGPTTAGLDLNGRLVVLNLEAFYDSDAIGIVMACAAAWLRAIVAEHRRAAEASGRPGQKLIVVLDEAWKLLSQLGIGEWLQASFKLSRQLGVQHVIVMHRLSDLRAAGAEGSRERALAEGLLADTETRVIYAQPEDQIPWTRELLGLTATEAELLPHLLRGEALWRVGQRSFLVRHRLSPYERELVDTDARMRTHARDDRGT
jgi:type IV secretory pathway VirB4 component